MKRKTLIPILIVAIIAGFAIALFFPSGAMTTVTVAFCFGLTLFLLFKIREGGKNGTRA
jgi:uncharacterized membrane protein